MLCSSFTSRRSPSPAVRQTRSFATRIALLVVMLAVPATAARAQHRADGFVITGVNLAGFQVVDNALTATGTVTGTLAGIPFSTQITNFTLQQVADDPATARAECSVLHLELAPIHLNLLGLRVDTSAICLDLTANPHGGLLGNLLCGLAGGPLGLGGGPLLPNLAQIADLQSGLIGFLNASLGKGLKPADAAAAQGSVCTGDCEILELVLGPLNLSLLGLNVSLDDCNGGPVQVCISASRGEGLLGELLCGIADGGLLNLTLADIATIVRRLTALLGDGQLSQLDINEVTALVQRLNRR